MSPSGTHTGCHMAAWTPVPRNDGTSTKVMGEQAKAAHFTPGYSWCAVLGCCCPMAGVSKAGNLLELDSRLCLGCATHLCCSLQRIPTPKTNTSRLPSQTWLWLFPTQFASLHVGSSCLTALLVEIALISSEAAYTKTSLNGHDSVEQASKRQLFCN